MSNKKQIYELTASEASVLGYIIQAAIRTLEYDKHAGDYKSNDDFVVALDKPDFRGLTRLAKKF